MQVRAICVQIAYHSKLEVSSLSGDFKNAHRSPAIKQIKIQKDPYDSKGYTYTHTHTIYILHIFVNSITCSSNVVGFGTWSPQRDFCKAGVSNSARDTYLSRFAARLWLQSQSQDPSKTDRTVQAWSKRSQVHQLKRVKMRSMK